MRTLHIPPAPAPPKLSLYEKQLYCHARGFICTCRLELGKCRLLLYRNGSLFRTGDLVEPSKLPGAYAEKYTALYEYLINQAKEEFSTELAAVAAELTNTQSK